jgi:hypothetical protein
MLRKHRFRAAALLRVDDDYLHDFMLLWFANFERAWKHD